MMIAAAVDDWTAPSEAVKVTSDQHVWLEVFSIIFKSLWIRTLK